MKKEQIIEGLLSWIECDDEESEHNCDKCFNAENGCMMQDVMREAVKVLREQRDRDQKGEGA